MVGDVNGWSLFSGVGGFDLGLARAGIDVTLTCEIDPWRRRVLAARFPDAEHTDDVMSLRGRPGSVDVLAGGFPCQDLSVAGKRAGLDGARSGLFFEFARIADELELAARGGWVFLENVPGLLSSNGGRDFGIVLQTLADLGFAVGYRVLDSCFFGVPQRRRRVFIVAHSRADRARAVLFDGQGGARGAEPGGEARASVAGTLGGGSGKRGWCDDFDRNGAYVVSALTTRARRQEDVNLVAGAFSENQRAEVVETEYTHQLTTGGGKPGQGYPAARIGSQVRRLTPTECERLQGFPDAWTAVDGTPVYAQAKNGSWRCKEGTPDSRRYAAMGDAVTVNVIEWIAHRMYATHQAEEVAA